MYWQIPKNKHEIEYLNYSIFISATNFDFFLIIIDRIGIGSQIINRQA